MDKQTTLVPLTKNIVLFLSKTQASTNFRCDHKLQKSGGIAETVHCFLVTESNQTVAVDHEQFIPALQSAIPEGRKEEIFFI